MSTGLKAVEKIMDSSMTSNAVEEKKDVAQKWCCSVLKDYPDFVPGVTYGSLSDKSVKDRWATESCDTRVGGSEKKNCKGMWKQLKVKF